MWLSGSLKTCNYLRHPTKIFQAIYVYTRPNFARWVYDNFGTEFQSYKRLYHYCVRRKQNLSKYKLWAYLSNMYGKWPFWWICGTLIFKIWFEPHFWSVWVNRILKRKSFCPLWILRNIAQNFVVEIWEDIFDDK